MDAEAKKRSMDAAVAQVAELEVKQKGLGTVAMTVGAVCKQIDEQNVSL